MEKYFFGIFEKVISAFLGPKKNVLGAFLELSESAGRNFYRFSAYYAFQNRLVIVEKYFLEFSRKSFFPFLQPKKSVYWGILEPSEVAGRNFYRFASYYAF